MNAVAFPAIVFCVGHTGLAIANALAEIAKEGRSMRPLSAWAISVENGSLAVKAIGPSDLAASRTASVRTDSVANAVFDIVAEVLSLRHSWRLTGVMDAPLGVRLSIAGATWEMTPALSAELAAAFHAAARRQFGSRYFTEVCLLLPDLAPYSSDSTGILQDWSNVLETCDNPPGPSVLADSFDYCWWLGRINASGLTLPPLPTSIAEVATVIHEVVTSSPEQLPSTVSVPAANPSI
jgi:hypothetical protein